MEPLDLTKRPPRSPREKAAGLYFLPRTIDKIRAGLPGGSLGEYRISGFSQRLLDALGIDLAELTQVVSAAIGEDEVVAWVRAHSDPSKYDEINRSMETRKAQDLSPDRLAIFIESYGADERLRHQPLFDVIEADDRQMFVQ